MLPRHCGRHFGGRSADEPSEASVEHVHAFIRVGETFARRSELGVELLRSGTAVLGGGRSVSLPIHDRIRQRRLGQCQRSAASSGRPGGLNQTNRTWADRVSFRALLGGSGGELKPCLCELNPCLLELNPCLLEKPRDIRQLRLELRHLIVGTICIIWNSTALHSGLRLPRQHQLRQPLHPPHRPLSGAERGAARSRSTRCRQTDRQMLSLSRKAGTAARGYGFVCVCAHHRPPTHQRQALQVTVGPAKSGLRDRRHHKRRVRPLA